MRRLYQMSIGQLSIRPSHVFSRLLLFNESVKAGRDKLPNVAMYHTYHQYTMAT